MINLKIIKDINEPTAPPDGIIPEEVANSIGNHLRGIKNYLNNHSKRKQIQIISIIK